MAFKPVIIDTGVFKQLPSGEALDAGGWTLPTAGGTEDYALIADAAGNAVWAQPDHGDLAGLGDDDHPQYVRNVGETSNVDLGSQTLTTTGTVVGSNIPAPTASNQMLQATAADVAAWSTDITGLTSLTVDNIAIDGATILSTTGTVGFGDDNIITTGDISAANLTLSGHINSIDYIQFDTSYSDSFVEGRLQWNIDDGTLEIGMPGGNVNLQIGQETIVRVRNVSGSTIPNGTPIRISGSQSNRPTIAPADASTYTTSDVSGVTTEEILNNNNGYVTIIGLVRDVNTDAFSEGDLLWLDYSAPGKFTATRPDAPYSRVAVAITIRKHASEGIIAVNTILIPRLESASGVKEEANSDGDFLRWDAANSWWSRQGDSSIDHGSVNGLTDNDHPQYLWKTGWEVNYAQTGKTTLTVDNSTRTLSLTPTGADFEFWVEGVKYTKTIVQTATFTDTEGMWYFCFNTSGVLTASQTFWDIKANDCAGVCMIYWDATNKIHSLIGPEYHSYEMNAATHHYLHYTFKTRWESGLGVVINGDNLDVGAGKIYDEDIEINITDSVAGGVWQQDLTPALLPIFYRSGTSAWRRLAPSIMPVYLDTNISQVNTESGGSWSWTPVGVAKYFAYWVIASNDQGTPVILVPGQEDSGTLTEARDGNKLVDMDFGNLPLIESKVIARVIMQRQVASPYYNLVEVNDYRQVVDEPSGGGSIVGDHGNLIGLGDDDHPQYVVYTGAINNIDLGSYTFTTTGTVVGSNIPAPTVASKVLTSTGVGTATWQDSTGGVTDHGALTGLSDDDHPQYVTYTGASGTVNLGAEALTTTSTVVGSNVPAPTITGKVLTSTGANTATWQDPTAEVDTLDTVADRGATTDKTLTTGGLTTTGTVSAGLLTVDNITINGAVISSDTGAISFSNENLTTTGSMTANTLTDGTASLTGGSLTSVKLGSLATNGFVKTSSSDGTLSVDTSTYLTAEVDTLDTVADRGATTDKTLTTGGLTTTGTVSAGLLTVDNITINGAVISSDTGAISFSNENLTTTGFLSTSQGTKYTHGNNAIPYSKPQSHYQGGTSNYGTCVIDLPVGHINTFITVKIRGYQYESGKGPWEVLFGGYSYNFTPDTWLSFRASVSGEPPFDLIRAGYNGNTGKACIMLGETTTNWRYALIEVSDVLVTKTDFESGWAITFYTDETNFYNNDANQADPITVSWNRDFPAPTADNLLLASTGDKTATWTTTLDILKVDNITINGAVISSDTGAISFSDENLTTTGSMTVNTLTDGTASLTGGSLTSVKLGSLATNGFVKTSSSDGTLSVDTSTYLTVEVDTLDTVADRGATTDKILTTGGLTTTGTVSAGLLTVDNITINGAVISSDTGAISFSNENLTTTGSMTANTLTLTQGIYHNHGDGAYVYDKVFSNHTSGSPVTGTLVIDLPIAHNNKNISFKVRGYNYKGVLGPWEVNFGGYPYDTTIDRWYYPRASVHGEVPFTLIRCGYNGNTGKTCLMLGETTTNWYHPTTEITDVVSGGLTTSLETGWDISFYTDETNFYNNDATQMDPHTVSWNRDYKTPSAVNQILAATGSKTADWTTTLSGLTSVAASGTVTGSNIPSPTADDQALTSSAAGVASWNITCLADVLAQEVPSASGAERKYVLTANSASKFVIESAPWTIMLTSNETVYVRTTGNDTIGDGSSGSPFLTLERTITYLGGLYIGDYEVTIDIGEGVFTEAGTLTFQHPFGTQVTWQGVSEQITSQNTTSIGSTGTSLGFSNLYRYDVTFTLPVGKSVSIGDYIAVREVTGGTLPECLYGCHYVSGWNSGTRVATVQVVYRNGASKASGTVTCTIELIKTVIAFSNKNGLKVGGTYTGGIWKGLVFQGNYDTTNTSAKYGIWLLNGSVISFGGASTTGWGIGIVGFQTGVYAQNNSMFFGDHCFISKCGTRCCNAQNGGILNLRYSRLSGANNNGIFAFNGSTVAATNVKVVAVGNDSILSYQGSFIDATSSYVDQNNATNAFTADRWAGVDITGASYSDALNPSSNPGNDGSYIIT